MRAVKSRGILTPLPDDPSPSLGHPRLPFLLLPPRLQLPVVNVGSAGGHAAASAPPATTTLRATPDRCPECGLLLLTLKVPQQFVLRLQFGHPPLQFRPAPLHLLQLLPQHGPPPMVPHLNRPAPLAASAPPVVAAVPPFALRRRARPSRDAAWRITSSVS